MLLHEYLHRRVRLRARLYTRAMGARLEQLQQAYLSLSEADRAAFSDWHAGIIRDQLSTSANSAVLLSGGTGSTGCAPRSWPAPGAAAGST